MGLDNRVTYSPLDVPPMTDQDANLHRWATQPPLGFNWTRYTGGPHATSLADATVNKGFNLAGTVPGTGLGLGAAAFWEGYDPYKMITENAGGGNGAYCTFKQPGIYYMSWNGTVLYNAGGVPTSIRWGLQPYNWSTNVAFNPYFPLSDSTTNAIIGGGQESHMGKANLLYVSDLFIRDATYAGRLQWVAQAFNSGVGVNCDFYLLNWSCHLLSPVKTGKY